MKIIVTGGAGFIGSYLCDKLIKQKHQVICLDDLSKGSIENIKHLLNTPQFKFLEFDVVQDLPEEISNIDAIYHFASMASPNPFKPKNIHAFPFETMSVNTTGTWNLCEFAVKNHAKLLFASTSEVYGDPLEHPQKESYRGNVSTTGPRAVYDEAKRFGETIVSAFVRSKGLDARIIRIFNTYGPRMAIDDGRVVIEFIAAALQDKNIPIFGDGSQTRSFCYILDLIEGINAITEKGEAGEIYNIGNPQEFTILELAKRVKQLAKSKSKIEFKDMPSLEKDQPMRRRPDITKAKQMLGWKPSVELKEGLTETMEYVKRELGAL